jgi:hypothetical protein
MAMTETSVEDQKHSSQTTLVDTEDTHKKDLLEQYYLTLNVKYLGAPRVDQSVVHERIERLFKSDHSWRNAYEIEQLLCFVLSAEQLASDLGRRLAEAQALKLGYVDVIKKELEETGTHVDKRIVLHQLLDDLQWFYSKRDQYRIASKRLMLRVSLLFMVALVTFSLVLFIQFFAHQVVAGSTRAVAQNPVPAVGPAPVVNPAAEIPAAPNQSQKPGGDK